MRDSGSWKREMLATEPSAARVTRVGGSAKRNKRGRGKRGGLEESQEVVKSIECVKDHQRRFIICSGLKSQFRLRPPSYTLATDSCHMAGVTNVAVGAENCCCGSAGALTACMS
jgi:hypothetical protein